MLPLQTRVSDQLSLNKKVISDFNLSAHELNTLNFVCLFEWMSTATLRRSHWSIQIYWAGIAQKFVAGHKPTCTNLTQICIKRIITSN